MFSSETELIFLWNKQLLLQKLDFNLKIESGVRWQKILSNKRLSLVQPHTYNHCVVVRANEVDQAYVS